MPNQIDMKHPVSNCILLIFLTFIFSLNLSAQALLTYGDQSITKEDFLKAYRKNNSKGRPTEKSYNEYLELYDRLHLIYNGP